MQSDVGFGVAIFAAAFITILMFVIMMVLYVLGTVGLYKIAEKSGVEHSWFAFVPILQFYTLGRLIGEIKIGSHVIPELELLLSIGFFARYIPVFGIVFNIIWVVLLYMTLFELYKLYKGDKAVLMLVISIITLGLAIPIILFAIRNEEPWAKVE